jgi:hypothetical protein
MQSASDMHGAKHIRATLILTRINAQLHSGRLTSSGKLRHALGEVEQAIGRLEQLPADRERLEHTALAYQLKSKLDFDLGDFDAGLDAGLQAGRLFEQAGGKGENFGRFLHDFASQLDDLNVPDLPLRYARRAAEVLAPYGEPYRSKLAEFIRQLEDGTTRVAPERLEDLRAALASASGYGRAEAGQALAIALLESDTLAEHFDELNAAIQTAFEVSFSKRRRNGLDGPTKALQLVIELYWRGLALPDWTPTALETLLKEIRKAERIDLEADVLTLRALWLIVAGQSTRGLLQAVEAVALHDEVAVRSDTSLVRMLTGRVNSYGRVFALAAAVEAGDAELVAELIESARLQVEPDNSSSRGRAHAASSRVGRLRRISVGGRSRLAGEDGVEVLALEDAITAVGGPGAAWWGTWAANERIFWALWLHGHWHCGVVSLTPGEQLTEALKVAWEHSPLTPRASPLAILTGPWCATPLDEEALSKALGSALIPHQLQDALVDALFDDKPLSLVLAGNLLAMLPVPLLGFATPERQSVRVLEAATLRVAAPTVLVNRALDSETIAAELNPLHVACVDPRDDLVNSREPPYGARKVLGGDLEQRDGPATLDELTEALGVLRPGQPGVFYYSGHAGSPGSGGDDQDALALAGDDTLSAHALFSGEAPVSMPARVILSACSSAGATGAGAGEWLGLTAAMLWRGARQVVATNWPIWDTPFTTRFDHELAHRLQHTADVAGTLRELQLEALTEWLASDHDLSNHEHDGLPYGLDEIPFPLIWAAYSCVGVFR